jgi:hypothetical protein
MFSQYRCSFPKSNHLERGDGKSNSFRSGFTPEPARYSILIHQGNRQPILTVDGVFSDILMVGLPQKNKDGFRPITPNIIAIFMSLRGSYPVNRFHRTIVSLREITPRNSLLGKI